MTININVLITNERITDNASRLIASLSFFGSTMASSYCKVAKIWGMAALAEYNTKIPKASAGYSLVRTGVISKGINCAINEPENKVNTSL